MNQLPVVVGATGQPLEVPCVCDPWYFDGLQYETFPLRKGFKLVEHDAGYSKYIFDADATELSPEAFAKMMQAWLFFGLLIEVLKVSGVVIDVEDFIEHKGQGKYITTKSLPDYLNRWEQKERTLPRKECKARFLRQQYMITHSMFFREHQVSGRVVLEDLHGKCSENYQISLPLPIEMSIMLLEETLDLASRKAYGIGLKLGSDSMLLSPSLITNLNSTGWCPSEVSLITRGFDDSSIVFASQVQRHRTKANHSKCSNTKCRAFNIVTANYRTQHTIDCRNCSDVAIIRKELASTLRQGLIPRACIGISGKGDTLEPTVTIEDSGPYIAISHVWSDGLGNTVSNALPSCQLLRLRRLALRASVNFRDDVPAIWIDTLLVPVEKGKEKRMALSQLYNYYQRADIVLVLDSDLLEASRECSEEEILTRICFSSWMRRLWTLEEGILSRDKLVFQFRDGPVPINSLTKSVKTSSNLTRINFQLRTNLVQGLPDIANLYRQPAESTPIIAELLRTLQYRSTTKALDEPLCIAHILGLDASRLVVIDEVDIRMRELLRIFAEIRTPFPMGFLFTHEPKLQLDGFRWAPISFMALDTDDTSLLLMSNIKEKWTTNTEKGLLISGMPGFTLNYGKEQFKKINFVEVDKRIYAITPMPIDGPPRNMGRFWSMEVAEEALHIDTSHQWSVEWQAMLNQNRPQKLGVLYEPGWQRGLLISQYDYEGNVSDEEGTLIYARPVGKILIYELGDAATSYPALAADTDVIRFTNPGLDFEKMEKQELEKWHDPKTSTFLRCTAIDPCQRWCIG